MTAPKQTGFLPPPDQLLADNRAWSEAMAAYHHARSRGLSRLDAFEALKPLLEHPRLADSARLMQDLANRFPE